MIPLALRAPRDPPEPRDTQDQLSASMGSTLTWDRPKEARDGLWEPRDTKEKRETWGCLGNQVHQPLRFLTDWWGIKGIGATEERRETGGSRAFWVPLAPLGDQALWAPKGNPSSAPRAPLELRVFQEPPGMDRRDHRAPLGLRGHRGHPLSTARAFPFRGHPALLDFLGPLDTEIQ